MTDERTKFEAWAKKEGLYVTYWPMYWRSWQARAALASQQKAHTDHPMRHWDRTCPACQEEVKPVPAFIDRDGEYIPPLSDRERATKFGEAIAKGLSQIGKPVPAGLDEVAEKVWRERAWIERPELVKFRDAVRAVVAELTKGQEPVAFLVRQYGRMKLFHADQQITHYENDGLEATPLYAAPIPAVPTGWPECEEFYNLMQKYRHAPIADQQGVCDAYQAVIDWVAAAQEVKP